jgi:hypothetical protein
MPINSAKRVSNFSLIFPKKNFNLISISFSKCKKWFFNTASVKKYAAKWHVTNFYTK